MKFSKTHEWANLEEDGTVTVGVSDHAQHALGDIVFVELPELGEHITAGKECGVFESAKSASDLYSPISGEVIVVNDEVFAAPDLLNKDPQGAGWLFKVRPVNLKEIDLLLDTKVYEQYLVESAH